jgi:acetyl esterase/lipase
MSSLNVQAAPSKPTVLFFAGYLATSDQMQCWEANAQANAPNYTFAAYAWPAGAPSAPASTVVQDGASLIQDALNRIDAAVAADPNALIIVGGHSSGAALSNAVAAQTTHPQNVQLVDLDGFVPDSTTTSRVAKWDCWYGDNGNGLQSLNASSTQSGCGTLAEKYVDTTCTTVWCLHYSIVNKSAPGDLGDTSADIFANGYDGCQANLNWLSVY